MKYAIVAIALIGLSGCAQQNMANDVFVGSVKSAVVHQDFRHWNLPDFIPGGHMRGKQYVNYKGEIVTP